MNKNQKYSELLRFVARIAKEKCTGQKECLSCMAIELLRRVTHHEDAPIDTGE